jgi:hypothetical protein
VEGRRASRYRLDLPVTFSWTGLAGRPCQGVGFTRDISSVAMFVRTGDCPPSDAIVHCEVMLPRFRNSACLHLKAFGRVLRVENAEAMDFHGFAVYGDMLLLWQELCGARERAVAVEALETEGLVN